MKFQFTLDGRMTVKIKVTSRGDLKLGGNPKQIGTQFIPQFCVTTPEIVEAEGAQRNEHLI
jgi:hypothetical protein